MKCITWSILNLVDCICSSKLDLHPLLSLYPSYHPPSRTCFPSTHFTRKDCPYSEQMYFFLFLYYLFFFFSKSTLFPSESAPITFCFQSCNKLFNSGHFLADCCGCTLVSSVGFISQHCLLTRSLSLLLLRVGFTQHGCQETYESVP